MQKIMFTLVMAACLTWQTEGTRSIEYGGGLILTVQNRIGFNTAVYIEFQLANNSYKALKIPGQVSKKVTTSCCDSFSSH